MAKFLQKEKRGVLLIDVQEKLLPLMDRPCELLEKICFVIEVAKILNLPIFVTEQCPMKLGRTVVPIMKSLPEDHMIYSKTFFSGYQDPDIKKAIDNTNIETWILIGIEAHICILQTAKDLLETKKNVILLADAISSHSFFDFSTAIAEMRENGARISSAETVIYEMIGDAATPEFKMILPLVKAYA